MTIGDVQIGRQQKYVQLQKGLTLDPFLSFLNQPLTLLVVGAAVSGWLLPRLARGWQDQRTGLEIKASLVERVTRAVMNLTTAVQFVLVGAASQSQEDFDTAYRTWQLEKAVITSLVGAYFRAPEVVDAWVRCRALTTAYYVQAGIRRLDAAATEAARETYLRSVAFGMSRSPAQDFSDDPRAFEEQADETPPTDLVDLLVLRRELERALTTCVTAIVDARMSLTSRS